MGQGLCLTELVVSPPNNTQTEIYHRLFLLLYLESPLMAEHVYMCLPGQAGTQLSKAGQLTPWLPAGYMPPSQPIFATEG